MKIRCDFCGNWCPKFKFPNPVIRSNFMGIVIPAGYFLACVDCAILFEDYRFTELSARGFEKPEWHMFLDHPVEFRLELGRIYTQILRHRTSF